MSKTTTDEKLLEELEKQEIKELEQELEKLMKPENEEDQNNTELSGEKTKIQIAEMESTLSKYNPKNDLEEFANNLTKSLEIVPSNSLKNPKGSKTGEGKDGCCTIS